MAPQAVFFVVLLVVVYYFLREYRSLRKDLEGAVERAIDARLAGPVIIALLAVVLIRRTAGVYTRWLAVIIIISAAGLFYVLDPSIFKYLLKLGTEEGIRRVQ